MLHVAFAPMKTTTMGNSSPCHSHFSYVGETIVATMHPLHDDNHGEKSTPPCLVASNQELEVENLEL
jgi:hypothetical protein